jgi:hypothetical protein
MLRRDITHAGYGLPWSFKFTPTSVFPEVASPPASGVGIDPMVFNEITPHAISVRTAGATSGHPGTDYMVLKSALLPLPADNSSAGRWGYLEYAVTPAGVPASYIKRVNDTATDLRNGDIKDSMVVLATTVDSNGAISKQLLNTVASTDPATFSFQITDSNFVAPAAFQPSDPSSSYVVYGISPVDSLKMPYNRADYYVLRPADTDAFKIPISCNPGTGILFKAVASHGSGYQTPYPLLNCVGDMKVAYSLAPPATNPGGDTYISAASSTLAPDAMRSQVRSIMVSILTHEGKKDMNYSYPTATVVVAPTDPSSGIPMASVGTTWTNAQMTDKFGADWKHYRWKVYTISVTPKNL